MTFRARNGEGAQALHINRFAKREEGWAIYEPDTGSCEVAINTGTLGDGELALTVQSGVALLDGDRLEIEEQAIDVPIAQTEPRKDVIALTENGAVFRAGGDQALKYPEGRELLYSERPAPPDLIEDPVVPLAVVAVPADVESISVNNLRDVRPAADYSVGTINGVDPSDWLTSDELDDTGLEGSYLPLSGGTLSGNLTVDSGDESDVILANNGDDSLRVRATETGEVEWSVYDSTGDHIATPFGIATNGVLDVNNGMGVEGDATFGGDLTVNQLLTADAAELSSVGEAGYSMGSGVHYSRDEDGTAVIYSVSSSGGNGWTFRDPDDVGDAVTISPSGDTTVNGILDADEIRESGSTVLGSVDILDSGAEIGSATSLNFSSNLSVSIANDVANISSSGNGGGGGYGSGGYGDGASGRSVTRAIDYGADPTGETSSVDALQTAINDANEGEIIVWGNGGTYYLDDEITINKQITVDLGEGVIESDYHDESSYENQSHYMPLFRVSGSLGTDSQLTAAVDRGDDQVSVGDPENYSVGEGVLLRTSTDALGSPIPAEDYMVTQTKVREIQDGVIYLEDAALQDYTTSDYLTHADYVRRPVIRNVTITNRRELAFDDTAGKVLGGFRHGIATELCDRPVIENCTAVGYDSHLWTSRDDIAPVLRDCEARRPMNLSGSCGEPVHIESSRDVSIVRPTIKEARRGIDARSGCGQITVTEPDITGISLVGISWHSITDVESDIEVNGGRVECKPDDLTHDNPDGSLDRRQELQRGAPFTTGANAKFISNDVTYVGRINATINGEAEIRGGEIHKYRTTGEVLTINGEHITIAGTKIGSSGSVTRLVGTDADTAAAHVTMEGIALDCSGGPSRAVQILGGEDISIDGNATDGATTIGEISAGSDISLAIDGTATGEYVHLVSGGDDITINGSVTGSVTNEQIEISGGSDISIDANLQASGGAAVRGVRILDGSDIDITGVYRGPGSGILFSGNATNTKIHDMRVEVTDINPTRAIGADSSPTNLQLVKCIDNDLRGSVDTIVMDVDVNGLWAVNNTCSSVEYTDATTVGQVAGNLTI